MSQMVEGAGGSSVNVPFAEVIPAMQRGVAQCAVTGTSAGNTARWWEVSDHLYALPMGWSMTFFGANLNSWKKLDEKTRTFLEQQFAEMEGRMWAQAGSDIQDGVNCNTGSGPCKDGIEANPKMKFVNVSDADKAVGSDCSGTRRLWLEWHAEPPKIAGELVFAALIFALATALQNIP
jgi:TRAP-type transport system periplasmic protein